MFEKRKRQPINRRLIYIVAGVLSLAVIGVVAYIVLRQPHFEFSGELWDMHVDVDRYLDANGDVIDVNTWPHDIVVKMASDGDDLIGAYVEAISPACSQASFSGTVSGNQMSWVVTYAESSSCCPGAQMEFDGTIADDGKSITGEFTPIGRPPTSCWIWWGAGTLTQQ